MNADTAMYFTKKKCGNAYSFYIEEDEGFTLSMLMGGILSFLYMPETNEENIKKYVKKITSLIL